MNNFNAGINTALAKAENDARDAYGCSLLNSYLAGGNFAAAIDGIVLNAKHEADGVVDRNWEGSFPSIRAIKAIREAFDAQISLLYCKRLFEASDRRNGWTGDR